MPRINAMETLSLRDYHRYSKHRMIEPDSPATDPPARARRAVLVLRPEPGNATTCAAAIALGLDPIAAPLFRYCQRAWNLPAAIGSYQGILAGSMAVFAHGGAGLSALHALPVHAVGAATADAARGRGFAVGTVGSGGLQAVADQLAPGHYLRLAGEERVPLTPPRGVTIDDAVVYAAEPVPIAPDTLAMLKDRGVLVLLHSAQAARHWRAHCIAHGLSPARFAIACLGPRIASTAGPGWMTVGIAQKPDDQALLSMAVQMCQTL